MFRPYRRFYRFRLFIKRFQILFDAVGKAFAITGQVRLTTDNCRITPRVTAVVFWPPRHIILTSVVTEQGVGDQIAESLCINQTYSVRFIRQVFGAYDLMDLLDSLFEISTERRTDD